MDPSLKPLLVLQDVEKIRLPVSSYRQCNFSYARFVPFVVANETGLLEHNQLNWVALYLLSMNKREISDSDTDVLNAILKVEKVTNDTREKIKEFAAKLSKNFQNSEKIIGMLENVQNHQDLQAIKDKINETFAGKPIGSRLTEIEESIGKLSEKMERPEDNQEKIKELAAQLSKNLPNSEELKGMLESVQKNHQDLKAIKDKINEAFAGKPIASRLTETEKSIEKLSEKMEGLGKKIDFIASKFGYGSQSTGTS